MANGKKSFILYADLIHTVKKMPKGKQADLFMTILKYVNDENPVVDDLIVGLVWEPIKLQLKRDLKDWEDQKVKRSEAGKIGMEKRWGNTENITKDNGVIPVITKDNSVINAITKITDTVNVTVNDTVIDNINKKGDFVCYDVEDYILKNQIAFEKICIATGKSSADVKTFLHEYHLWLTKNEKYPMGKRAAAAGAESWILNAKNFNKNGNATTKTKPGTSEARIAALREW